MTRRILHLELWEEVVGILKCVKDGKGFTKLILINKHNEELEIVFPKSSSNTNFAGFIGQLIGVLRTDELGHEILIRKTSSTTSKTMVVCPRVEEKVVCSS